MTVKPSRRINYLSEAQGHRCAYCGVPMILRSERIMKPKGKHRKTPPAPAMNWRSYSKWKKFRRATVDHIIPRCDGGTDAVENLVVACLLCNQYRGNQPAQVAFLKIQKLVRKKTHPHLVYATRGYFPIDSFQGLPPARAT